MQGDLQMKSVSAARMTDISDLPNGVLHAIFDLLGPKELCVVSAVCKEWRELNRDTVANQIWQQYYTRRWRAPIEAKGAQNALSHRWQVQYGKKMRNARAFSNRGIADVLHGHKAAVTGCALLPSLGLLATGSLDNTVRLWDLNAGLPIASSRQLRGPIRCLAADVNLLACGGGPDGMVRVWRAHPEEDPSERFDLTLPTRLAGHTGPVSALTLTDRHIYSASWDCSVRIWNRTSLHRESLLAFPDWIHSVRARAGNLLVTAGNVLHVHNEATGQGVYKFGHTALTGGRHWEEGRSTAPLHVEAAEDGRTVFLGGADGALISIDLRSPRSGATVLWNQKSPIKSLKYEDPWLAAATACGSVLLVDVEATTANLASHQQRQRGKSDSARTLDDRLGGKQRATRQTLTAMQAGALCVDIQDNFVACGSTDPVVRTWLFDHVNKSNKRSATAPRRRRQAAKVLRGQKAGWDGNSGDDERPSNAALDETQNASTLDSLEATNQECLRETKSNPIPLSSSLPTVLGTRPLTRPPSRPFPHWAAKEGSNAPYAENQQQAQRTPQRNPSRINAEALGSKSRPDSSPTAQPTIANPHSPVGMPQAGVTSPPASPIPGASESLQRWDRLESDVSSDSDWANDIVMKSRDRGTVEQNYRLSESPQRSHRGHHNRSARVPPRVLPPALSCRSESGDQARRLMADWRLSTGDRLRR